MKTIIITGSLGLIGFEAVNFFIKKNYIVIGIDNNFRGRALKTETYFVTKLNFLNKNFPSKYLHFQKDIREEKFIYSLFKKYNKKIDLIIHTAAQTSHDWSGREPKTDFYINAVSTFNLLEGYREHCPQAVFIFTSTNKVYGDLVNKLDFKELKTRYDLGPKDSYYFGINENFSIDQSLHSPFGVSKASADLMVQEYGRYFGLKTVVFRLGVVAGGQQSGTYYQGFLSYMINQLKKNKTFEIVGYQGKQVRDIIDAEDVVRAFYLVYKNSPRPSEVFNLGGGRKNAYSVIELIDKVQKITKKKLKIIYKNKPRKGDHQWWITDTAKFKKNYPEWKVTKTVDNIILEIFKNDKLREI